MKFFKYIIIVFCYFPLFANSIQNDFALLTIPKTGSGLVQKCIEMLVHKKPIAFGTKYQIVHCIEKVQFSPNEFMTSHFDAYKELDKYFLLHPNYKKIIQVRDLRDACVSAVFYIDKHQNYYHAKYMAGFTETKENWDRLSFDEKLMKVITANPDKFLISCATNAREALRFLQKDPKSLLMRFENLVGDKGGGDDFNQRQEILKLATFLNINVSDKELENISQSLFGNKGLKSSTFRSGQIGKWKEHFKEEHKEAFKECLGSYLIELGYEKNNNW